MSVPHDVLRAYRTIAVVGLSSDASKDSYEVAQYLQQQGYRIIPVNPAETEVLGERAYASLLEAPDAIEVVDIFRRPEHVLPIVEEAIQIGARVVWMQLGIVNEEAAARAMDAGLTVIMNHCMKREHKAARQRGEV